MKIKITFDPDGCYGYPKDEIIEGKRLVADYIETLNEVEDADTINFLKNSEIDKSVDFVAEMWGLNYDIIPDDKVIRKCSVCGKNMIEGYVFDGTTCFCSKECATIYYDDDPGCVDILIDEGNRLVWMNELPSPPHYRVSVGCCDGDFFYCDSWEKLCRWLSEKLCQNFVWQSDIDEYNKDNWRKPIDIIVFGPKEYLVHRKEYVAEIRICDDLLYKAQRARTLKRRNCLIGSFHWHYENAHSIDDIYPEVWQGEI